MKKIIFKAYGYEELSILGNTWQPFKAARTWEFSIGEKSSIHAKTVSLSDLKDGYCRISPSFWMEWDNSCDVHKIDANTVIVEGELYSRFSD